MKLKPVKRVPALIALGVILLFCLLRCLQLDFFERLEAMSFDIRVRHALTLSPPIATNLGFVFIDEQSLKAVQNGSLGFHYGLAWPRVVYARLIEELAIQGARAVAFDVILGELRGDLPPVQIREAKLIESDDYFALQMRRASNVIIAVTKQITPPSLFLTNAAAFGDITTEKDPDGILRRVQIFRFATNWHPIFRQVEADPEYGVDLNQARLEPGRLVLPRYGVDDIVVPIAADGTFALSDLTGKLPKNMAPRAKPFSVYPLWHMGVVLAARELNLDLAHADVDLPHGRITLRGPAGLERTIPVDDRGYSFVNWALPPNDPQLTQESIQDLLAQRFRRLNGETTGFTNLWGGRLAVVGSSALIGNNLTDRGATPLDRNTLLVSKHWNVANSIITNQFIHRSSLPLDLGIIALVGAIVGFLTWKLRVPFASTLSVLVGAAYPLLAAVLYFRARYWIPVVFPVGVVAMTYACVASWRIVFEQAEQRRVKSIFSTVVSPKIMKALLDAPSLSLGGARRQITVLFADVRGFTEFTDTSQARAAEFVQKHKLSGDAAEACYDEQARETLNTVNLYLGLVADTIIKYDATLDKFIGDCVMAFWGAPTSNPKHALACVQAAIAAQRAIHELNEQRAAENKRREQENLARATSGLDPLPPFPLLLLGSGINTGMATVGLMGSETKSGVGQGNYTVFGRDVNLASRLEGLSGRGRIFLSEATYQHLQRDEPALAATCIPQPPARVKGISADIKVYEVPWRAPGPAPTDTNFSSSPHPEPAALPQPSATS